MAIPNGNILWLSEAFRRYLQGDSMASGFYEPNPPLALFTGAPQIFLSWLTGASIGHCIVVVGTFFVFLSAYAVNRILQTWPFLQKGERHALVCVYILANTILNGPMFGERDHLLGLGLVPFVLMQASLTFQLPYNKKLAACVFFVGAWLILLKPHYGLLVTLIIVYRALRLRRPSTLFALDFVMLAIATIACIAGTWVFFPDFVHTVMPDGLLFYARSADIALTYKLAVQYMTAAAVLLGFILYVPAINAGQKHMAAGLTICGMIALIPFVLQGRGYYYHLIPSMIFLWLALNLRIQSLLSGYTTPRTALACGVIFMTALTYRVASDRLHPTEQEYAQLPLVREAMKCGQPPCTFFIFAPGLEIPHEIAYASGGFHASRFPSFWFLPSLLVQQDRLEHGGPTYLTQEQVHAYRGRYAHMVAEDFRRYRPTVVMLVRFRILKDGDFFVFPTYFSVDKNFKALWEHYHKVGSATILVADYIPGIATNPDERLDVDIYRLDKAAPWR